MQMTAEEEKEGECRVAVPKWRKSLSELTSKLNAQRSWIAVMLVLGTADMLLNLINFVELSDGKLQYGLVIGPPSVDIWISMCIFTIVGTLLYFPETANTLSAIYNPYGETLVPIHLELLLTLSVEHIPLAIVDYFADRCRRHFTTKLATWCHSNRLVFVFTRFLWYADMEGKKIRKNDKYKIQQVLVLVCCLLYSVSAGFNIMDWNNEPDTRIKDYHLVNVSIFLLNYPPPPEQPTFSIPLTEVLLRQSGPNITNAWLTETLSCFFISKGKPNVTGFFTAGYTCNVSKEYPIECSGSQELSFRFTYAQFDWAPYGAILYNFARVPLSGSNEKCVDSKENLRSPWKLYFYEAQEYNGTMVDVSAPFRKACTHPRPMYSSDVSVCPYVNSKYIPCSGN